MRVFAWTTLLLLSLACLAGPKVQLVSTDYPPYFSPTMAENGTVVAIARAAFEAAGYEVEVEFRPWARLLAETRAGNFDAVVAVWYSADRNDYLTYSEPLVETLLGFYGRREQPIEVRNLGALREYQIGTVRGYANPPAFEAANLNKDDAVDDMTNLRKLAAGRLDLVLIDQALAGYLLQKEPALAARLEWRDPPVQKMPLYLGIAKKRPTYLQTQAAFNRGLAEIRRNGTLERILTRLPLPK
ncbi:substrate-binding periplasmic protein [Chitinimonas sp.]|uniref:substrate-binding periplasmic protein n=1 Tax=Chitinimonas sp. TaxID=1934313 RepID=UPI0035B2379B